MQVHSLPPIWDEVPFKEASQYISKKMREVKVTLKVNYKVLLLPKA
jgi:hypothetical protein